MKLIMRTFLKCLKSGCNHCIAILQICTSPINGEILSPPVLVGRKKRGLAPIIQDNVNESICDALERKQQKMKQNHDQHATNKNSNNIDIKFKFKFINLV